MMTKLINADVELSKLSEHPEKSPLLMEEVTLMRSIIAKQNRILSIQDPEPHPAHQHLHEGVPAKPGDKGHCGPAE